MDSIAVSHQVPQSITVIHRIDLEALDARKIFALQSSIRTFCITSCVVLSISVIAGSFSFPHLLTKILSVHVLQGPQSHPLMTMGYRTANLRPLDLVQQDADCADGKSD